MVCVCFVVLLLCIGMVCVFLGAVAVGGGEEVGFWEGFGISQRTLLF